jgi:hypothetical protein
LMVE